MARQPRSRWPRQAGRVRSWIAAPVAVIALGCLPATAASSTPVYRVCARSLQGQHVVVRATDAITCAHAVQIAVRGDHSDGDDGARFGYLDHTWQCVTTGRPDHGQQTQFGCYTPRAKVGTDYVTFLIFSPAD